MVLETTADASTSDDLRLHSGSPTDDGGGVLADLDRLLEQLHGVVGAIDTDHLPGSVLRRVAVRLGSIERVAAGNKVLTVGAAAQRGGFHDSDLTSKAQTLSAESGLDVGRSDRARAHRRRRRRQRHQPLPGQAARPRLRR